MEMYTCIWRASVGGGPCGFEALEPYPTVGEVARTRPIILRLKWKWRWKVREILPEGVFELMFLQGCGRYCAKPFSRHRGGAGAGAGAGAGGDGVFQGIFQSSSDLFSLFSFPITLTSCSDDD